MRQNASLEIADKAPHHDALLASLEATAADAVRAHDWATVAAIGQLIDKRVQALAAAAPPKVASLADARKRRDENGGGK